MSFSYLALNQTTPIGIDERVLWIRSARLVYLDDLHTKLNDQGKRRQS
jgi:hypothetical protein